LHTRTDLSAVSLFTETAPDTIRKRAFPSKCWMWSRIKTKYLLLKWRHWNEVELLPAVISFTACHIWDAIIPIHSQERAFLPTLAPLWLPDPPPPIPSPGGNAVKSIGVGEFDFQVWILSIWGKSNLRKEKIRGRRKQWLKLLAFSL
jgi:hypothetical protein